MNSFYEKSRDDNTSIHISRTKPHTYPSHFHQNLEVFILRRGKYSLTINGVETEVNDGTVVIIDSYDIHSYIGLNECLDDCAIVIPYRFLDKFNTARKNRKVSSNYIYDTALCDSLLKIIDEYILRYPKDSDIVDAGVQLFLAMLLVRLDLSDSDDHIETPLIRKILSFIQSNYTKDVTRKTIASALGYTEAHISRVFHKYLKRGIQDYVNTLRLGYIERARRSSPKTLTELIYEAGFGSEQSYYRTKKLHNK